MFTEGTKHSLDHESLYPTSCSLATKLAGVKKYFLKIEFDINTVETLKIGH